MSTDINAMLTIAGERVEAAATVRGVGLSGPALERLVRKMMHDEMTDQLCNLERINPGQAARLQEALDRACGVTD